MRKIVCGNLNYSSWSIRPLLVARKLGLGLEEEVVALDFPGTADTLAAISPTARVPLLIWDNVTIWESLAITEFLAEQGPPGAVWPQNPEARATARAICAEMATGFNDLRRDCWMDIRGRHDRPTMTAGLSRDVQRVQHIWHEARQRFGADGPFLFGRWSAADAFYTPVITRFRTWDLPLDAASKAYSDAILSDPDFKTLEAEAEAEPWWIDYGPDGRSSGYVKDT